MTITGRVVRKSVGADAWGISDDAGKEWMVINMPDQLKIIDALVQVDVIPSQMESLFMWGTPIEIISFHTLPRL